jgi:hypothetical protein
MDHYHDTHYMLFHTLLPSWLRGELFSPFVDAVVKGDGGSFLVGLWRGVAKKVSGKSNLKSPLNLTRDDFSTQLIQPAAGKAIIFIETPPVEGPLEAAFVVVYFEEQDPIGTLRYFTCEAADGQVELDLTMAYYLNNQRSNSTLLGVSQPVQPNFYAARNVRA